MKIADLMSNVGASLRGDRGDTGISDFCLAREKRSEEKKTNKEQNLKNSLSTPSSYPVLIPLDAAFVEGQRYRLSRAVEIRSRLDVFIADDAGPWLRRHGVLIAVEPSEERG